MYLWYSEATVCYVSLSDCELCPDFDRQRVQIERESIERESIESESDYFFSRFRQRPLVSKESRLDLIALNDCMRHQLHRSRWFTRGWTLQELLAPRKQIFFDRRWQLISYKSDILPTLKLITGVGLEALKSGDTTRYAIAQRMYWASKRETTRIEDEAYCLLGIFGVRLPLIYGEGSRAFLRLQEEIVKTSRDQSIFAWELRPGVDKDDTFHCLFAPSVANFWWQASSIQLFPRKAQPLSEFHLTNQGVELQLYLDEWRQKHGFAVSIACLECWIVDAHSVVGQVGLRLRNTNSGLSYDRSPSGNRMHTQVEVELVSTIEEPIVAYRRLAYLPGDYCHRRDVYNASNLFVCRDKSFLCSWSHKKPISSFGTAEIELNLRGATWNENPWRIIAVHPRSQWHATDRTMTLPLNRTSSFGTVLIGNREQLRFTILIGLGNELRSNSKHTSFRYWIFPGPPDDWAVFVKKPPAYMYDSSFRGLYLREQYPNLFYNPYVARSDEYRFGLQRLCEQASSFATKDCFEHTTRRLDSHKSVPLPNGDILRVRIDDIFHYVGETASPGQIATYGLVVEPNFDSAKPSLTEFASFKPSVPHSDRGMFNGDESEDSDSAEFFKSPEYRYSIP